MRQRYFDATTGEEKDQSQRPLPPMPSMNATNAGSIPLLGPPVVPGGAAQPFQAPKASSGGPTPAPTTPPSLPPMEPPTPSGGPSPTGAPRPTPTSPPKQTAPPQEMPPIPADSLEPLPSAQGGQLFDGKKVKPKVQKPAAMEGIQKFGQKPQNMKQAEFHPTAHDGHPPTVGSGGSYRHQDAKKRGGKG